jgi:DNA repair exonuclease SbcCD ATPase subunit
VIRIPDEVEGKAEREAEQTVNLMRSSAVTNMLQNLASDIRVAKAEQAMAEQAYRTAVERKVQLEAEVAKCRDDLANLQFNNNLLKKVRAARPQVADQLWNTVLAAVSQMLTQMRGQQSVVAKSKDGFSVNGVPVTSLSGSALDLLALAIRCSLVRTFLPHVGVAVMDEVTAACDSDRTETMLGFLKVAGFSQVLLVSHEDAVDAVADHLIQL